MKSSRLRVTDGETEAREGKGQARACDQDRGTQNSAPSCRACPPTPWVPSGRKTQVAQSRPWSHQLAQDPGLRPSPGLFPAGSSSAQLGDGGEAGQRTMAIPRSEEGGGFGEMMRETPAWCSAGSDNSPNSPVKRVMLFSPFDG